MFSISVCMIVKNEEAVLDRCLSCVTSFADEIIIVDTGSTDSTKKIAKKYTKKVYDFKWINDFSAARNFAFKKGTKDYLMWLDADDIITTENQEKLLTLKNNNNLDVDVYMLKYVLSVDENNKPTYEFYRERLLKRSENFVWQDPIHEVITPHGNIKYEDIQIQHFKNFKHGDENRNLSIYENLIKNGKPFSPRMTYLYARELYYHKRYNDCIETLTKFLNSNNGWNENNIDACLIISKCYIELKDSFNALKILFQSFLYDTPRNEVLCNIGEIYEKQLDYKKALYYFTLAKDNTPPELNGGFVQPDYNGFQPLLHLSVCYYYLNDKKTGKKYHELAKKLKPKNSTIIYNEQFFK